jgi:hypothetical protein
MPRKYFESNGKVVLDEADPDANIYIPLRSVTDYSPLDRTLTKAQRSGDPNALLNNRAIHTRVLLPSKYYVELETFVKHSPRKMLNSKELARVLNANVHPKLFSTWMYVALRLDLTCANACYRVMSPNATLLAYSGTPNIQQTRDQAALLSQIWKEQKNKLREQDTDASSRPIGDHFSSSASTASTIVEGALETLTIESAKSNIIIRAVQPRLLLVLVGGAPPRRTSEYFKTTAEARGDPRYPPSAATSNDSLTGGAHDSARDSPPAELLTHAHQDVVIDESMPAEYRDLTDNEKMQMLDIQRNKVDSATEFMRGDFANKGFVMPDEISIP